MSSRDSEVYYIKLPEACPLEGARLVERNLEVYRIVENIIPADSDFEPLGLKPKSYFKKRSADVYCKSLALSVFKGFEDAEHVRLCLSQRYGGPRFVAKGVLTLECGRIKDTPGPSGDSHISWWPFLGIVPCTLFSVMEGGLHGS